MLDPAFSLLPAGKYTPTRESEYGWLGAILAIPAITAGKVIYNNPYADTIDGSQKTSV